MVDLESTEKHALYSYDDKTSEISGVCCSIYGCRGNRRMFYVVDPRKKEKREEHQSIFAASLLAPRLTCMHALAPNTFSLSSSRFYCISKLSENAAAKIRARMFCAMCFARLNVGWMLGSLVLLLVFAKLSSLPLSTAGLNVLYHIQQSRIRSLGILDICRMRRPLCARAAAPTLSETWAREGAGMKIRDGMGAREAQGAWLSNRNTAASEDL
eukprot:IDg11878t1